MSLAPVEPAISGLLCLHVALLLIAPYTQRYHALKKVSFLIGAIAALLVLVSSNISLTPAAAIVSIAAGYAGLLLSLCCANFSIRQGYKNFRQALSPRNWLSIPPGMLLLIVLGAVMEESIWRTGVQIRLGNNWLAIAVIAVLFHRCHLVRSRKVRMPKMLDILFFSGVNGAVFWATGSLPAVVAIHAIRNVHIFGLRYQHESRYQRAVEAARSAFQARFPSSRSCQRVHRPVR